MALRGLGRLRGRALALLLGRRRARALDRPQHRSLQGRIRSWLRVAARGAPGRVLDPAAGRTVAPRGSYGRTASARDASVARAARPAGPRRVAGGDRSLAADAPSAACRHPDRGAARRRAPAADAPSAACRHPDRGAACRRAPAADAPCAACRHPDRGAAGRPVPAARGPRGLPLPRAAGAPERRAGGRPDPDLGVRRRSSSSLSSRRWRGRSATADPVVGGRRRLVRRVRPRTRQCPPSKGGHCLRMNPAATYSPRRMTSKYHRRGRA